MGRDQVIVGLMTCILLFQGYYIHGSDTLLNFSNPFDLFTALRPFSQANNWSCNGTVETIRESWVCDGDIDCSNGYDEHIDTCNKTECYDDEFHCGDGTCVIGRWKCDGDEDCVHGEDEQNCTSIGSYECEEYERKCDDGYCVDSDWFCDSEYDCDDESDETEKYCAKNGKCPENTEYCVSAGECLPPSCCVLGSETVDCSQKEPVALECQQNEINCTTNNGVPTCVVLHHQCDGLNDCDDGSDEGGECSIPCEEAEEGSEDAGGCSHSCSQTPKGPVCTCKPGYRLAEDNKTCEDINECETIASCTTCENTEGSFKCTCEANFVLQPNGHECVHEYGRLIIHTAFNDRVRKFSLRYGRSLEGESRIPEFRYENVTGLQPSSRSRIVDIDDIHADKTTVWLEKSEASYVIKQLQSTKTLVLLNVSAENMKIQRISIDWIERNVFFTGQKSRKETSGDACSACGFVGLVPLRTSSETANFSSEERMHVIAENFYNLVDILVVSQKGLLFTCEYSRNGRLIAMSLDGSDSWAIHRGVSWPISLAYDSSRNELFWAQMPPENTEGSEEIYSIKSISATPGNPESKVIINRASNFFKTPFSIGYFNSKLFWYDVDRHEVLSVSVRNSNDVGVIEKFERKSETDYPQRPISVQHYSTQPSFDGNPCEQFGCEYACVITSTNVQDTASNENLAAECVCPANKYYDQSVSSCQARPSGPFLITYENGVIRTMYEHGLQTRVKTIENHSAYSLVYDPVRKRIYYSESQADIYYVEVNGTSQENVLVAKTNQPTRYLTIDPTSGNLYWITNVCSIKSWSPNGKTGLRGKDEYPVKTLFQQDGYCPKGLAYDYRRQKLFFIDEKNGPALYSVMSDGTGIKRVQSASSLSELIHMTYDPYKDSIVYVEKGVYDIVLIYSMRINKNDFYLHKPVSPDVTAITVSPTLIYSYDAKADKVWSQRKSKVGEKNDATVNKNSDVTTDDSDTKRGGGLVYVDPDLLESDSNLTKNPCWIKSTSKEDCSEFCFSAVSRQDGHHCDCADGYILAADNKRCIKNMCDGDSFYCFQYNTTLAYQRYSSEESFPTCVPRHAVCDRKMLDCYDGSDESSAVCGCPGPDFAKCKLPGDPEDGNYQCIKSDFICDGDLDCLNHADEVNCTCDEETNFKCPEENGTLALCISKDWVNDGESDCLGGGDETELGCLEGEVQCDNGLECIDELYFCDGTEDCSDESDESNCTVDTSPIITLPTTTPTTTTTKTTTEATTTKAPCKMGQFTCGSSECIRLNWVCDGSEDCDDGSDEGGKCEEKCPYGNYKALHCTSECHRTPQGPTCPCSEGYYFDHLNVKCVDIDECAKISDNQCDQICQNTPGSYKCVCVKGYGLSEDHVCKALGQPPFFLTATDNDFRLFTARSRVHYETTPLKLEEGVKIKPTVFAIRGVKDFFWVDGTSSSLYLSNEWSGKTTLLARHIPDITFMSWDWIAQNLVWTHEKTIEAVTAKGQYSAPLFTSENKINGMALFPPTGTLYYASYDVKSSGKLRRCSMSLKICKDVATEQSDLFRTLTVEAVSGDLYWVLHLAKKIERFSPDKTRKTVYEISDGKAVTGLHVFEEYVSWIEMNAKVDEVDGDGFVNISPASERIKRRSVVYSLHKKTGARKIVRENLPVIQKLEIIQKWSQPQHDFNPCIESPCPYICSQWVSTAVSKCTCPTKKLNITSAFPTPEVKNCPNLCPTPILATNGVALLTVNSRPDDKKEVLCPGHSTIYRIKCEENGTWSGLPYCPGGINVVPPPTHPTSNNRTSAVSQHSDRARNISIALIVLVMIIVIVCFIVYWRRKRGAKWFGGRGFSPQKLRSPRTSTSDAVGLYNPSYVVSYSPNDENSHAYINVETNNGSNSNGISENTDERP